MEHEISVADVVAHLVVGLLQQRGVAQHLRVGVHILCDVTTSAEDDLQTPLAVTIGHQLQLIVLVVLEELTCSLALFLLRLVHQRHVGLSHVLQVQMVHA